MQRRIASQRWGGAVQLRQPCRPEVAGDLQEFRGELPPERMVGGIEVLQRRPVDLLGLHRVDDFGEVAGKPHGIRRACGRDERAVGMDGGDGRRQPVAPGKDEAGKFQKPRRAGKRFGHVEEGGGHLVEEAAVVVRLAESADGGQDGRAPAEEIDEFRADDARRTPRRHIDGDVGKRQRIGGIVGEAGNQPPVDQAFRDRFQEGQARRDRMDAAARARRHDCHRFEEAAAGPAPSSDSAGHLLPGGEKGKREACNLVLLLAGVPAVLPGGAIPCGPAALTPPPRGRHRSRPPPRRWPRACPP